MSDTGRTAFGDSPPEDGVLRCAEQVTTPEPVDSSATFGDHADIVNIAVVGPRGVGKTTLIQSFIVCCRRCSPPITDFPLSAQQVTCFCASHFKQKNKPLGTPDVPLSGDSPGATRLFRCRTEVSGTTYTLNLVDCSSLVEAARLFDLSNVDAFVVCLSDDCAAESVTFAQGFDVRRHTARTDAVIVAAHLKSDLYSNSGGSSAAAHDAVDRAAGMCVERGAYVDSATAHDARSPRGLFARALGRILARRRPPPQPVGAAASAACATEYTFKVVVIGEVGAGKTALVKRLAHGAAPSCYKPTVGVDFDVVEYRVDARTTARVQLWDVSGQARFGAMTGLYYAQCAGALAVCDQARAATFFALDPWLDSFRAACVADVPVVLAANKSDLRPAVPAAELRRFGAQNRLAGCVDTCALTGRGCRDALRLLVDAMVAHARARGIQGTPVASSEKSSTDASRGQQKQKQQSEGPVLFTSWRF